MSGPPDGYEVRLIGARDWRQVRDIRLEMLADTPLAYVEPLETARRRSGEEWRARVAQANGPGRVDVACVLAGTGRWVGVARGAAFADRDDRPFVFSVYVAPAFRGRGVADTLLDRVEGWAHERGHPALYLFVHEDNARAIAFYRRRGYGLTGHREPYPIDPSRSELEMRLLLTDRAAGTARGAPTPPDST